MRFAPLAFAVLVSLMALALVPQAAGYPPVCIERNVEQGPLTAHVGQCGPQSAEADFCPSWGSPERHLGYADGRVLVDVEWCMPHSPPPASTDPACQTDVCPAPAMASAIAPPACVRECTPPVVPDGCELREATPSRNVGPFVVSADLRQTLWGSDCDVDFEPIGACAPPSGRMIERRVLFIDARILLCDGGLDPPAWS